MACEMLLITSAPRVGVISFTGQGVAQKGVARIWARGPVVIWARGPSPSEWFCSRGARDPRALRAISLVAPGVFEAVAPSFPRQCLRSGVLVWGLMPEERGVLDQPLRHMGLSEGDEVDAPCWSFNRSGGR